MSNLEMRNSNFREFDSIYFSQKDELLEQKVGALCFASAALATDDDRLVLALVKKGLVGGICHGENVRRIL
jgi:hypothetical protein